jgi:hypothetical protein
MKETTTENAPKTQAGADASRSWRRVVAVELARILAIAIVAGAVIAAFLPKRVPVVLDWPALPEGWSPVAWPFLRDQFDPGVAGRCAGPQCPVSFEITIRPKRGFCDCEHGVYDDTQLRQVGDLDLTGSTFTPRGPGEAISLAGLGGRARNHTGQNGEVAVTAALHKGCDVIVIVARGRDGKLDVAAVLGFLRTPSVEDWLAGLLKDQRPA